MALSTTEGRPFVRGSETDLLSRYIAAARASDAETIVRITSDCPLIDPGCDRRDRGGLPGGGRRLCEHGDAAADLPARARCRGGPTRAALERADREDRDPAWREHATPYLYRHPELFRTLRVAAEDDHADERWTLDTPEDYALIVRIYETLGRDDFTWREALAVVEANPTWGALNRHIVQKVVPPAGRGR